MQGDGGGRQYEADGPGRGGTRQGRNRGSRGWRERGAPRRGSGYRRGASLPCQAVGPPRALSGCRGLSWTRRGTSRAGSLESSTGGSRPGASGFAPARRPWRRPAGEGWCIGEAKVSPFCWAVSGSLGRRRVSALKRVPQEAAAAQLRSAGAAAALRTPAGEGVQAGGGEAAPRGPRRLGDWARGSGLAEEKLRSRFRDRAGEDTARKRRDREAQEGEKGEREPGGSRAAASRSRRSRDGLTAVARADPQPQGTKTGEGRRGRGKRGAAGRRAGAREEPAARAGLRRTAHIREPARRLGCGRCNALAISGWGERNARTTFSPPPSAPCVLCGGRTGAGVQTTVTSRGGALPVMWLEAGGGKRGVEGTEEMRGFPEKEEIRGVRGAHGTGKGGLGPRSGSLVGEEEQTSGLKAVRAT